MEWQEDESPIGFGADGQAPPGECIASRNRAGELTRAPSIECEQTAP